MPEETKDSKAQKIAAARKKLKEYQKRGTDNTPATNALPHEQQQHVTTTGGSSVSSNISESSDSELHSNDRDVGATDVSYARNNAASMQADSTVEAAKMVPSTVIASNISAASLSTRTSTDNMASASTVYESKDDSVSSVSAIKVLIAEKATLASELNKYRCLCREKDLELEELRLQFTTNSHRLEELQQHVLSQQQAMEQLRNSNSELQLKLTQANAKSEDQEAHVDELKRLLSTMQERAVEVEQQFKETSSKLEMAQLRIRQLSDEANVGPDNRVETLTQTQFMYEQQIRDLQAMVQQLSHDKEQANSQYQNYVQHLNAEIANLNEKNSELMNECTKQQERERQLVEHISGLEREIQKNISRQDQLKADKKQESEENAQQYVKEIEQLKEKISDFEFERHEFQLKIKSQEDCLEKLRFEIEAKQLELENLKEHLQNVTSEQPDQMKLLATMESDKVAASRALAQNVELKRQLDELELRFVQLTNDKADLVNKLDAEEHANREMRANYTVIEEHLKNSDERFKFKDEEMIRLSRENMELSRKLLVLQQQVDRLQHYEARGKYMNQDEDNASLKVEHEHIHDHDHHDHGHSRDVHNYSCHKEDMQNVTETQHHDHHNGCEEAHEVVPDEKHHHHQHYHRDSFALSSEHIPTAEAVEKLQYRFTQLMSQVADLTEEKHRLEHLVLQLQSETETIGEYITLYQTQRRILKQREYEKAAQMQLLQAEREQMCEKIAMLNNLVSSLSSELPHNIQLKEHLNAAIAEGIPHTQAPGDGPEVKESEELLNESAMNEKLNSAESQQILSKIRDIITEIKETTKEMPSVPSQAADHLKCCLGKFEVV